MTNQIMPIHREVALSLQDFFEVSLDVSLSNRLAQLLADNFPVKESDAISERYRDEAYAKGGSSPHTPSPAQKTLGQAESLSVKLYNLIHLIEKLPASTEQTDAVVYAGEIFHEICPSHNLGQCAAVVVSPEEGLDNDIGLSVTVSLLGFKVLLLLCDRIFDCLAVQESKLWPARFLRALQLGADLSQVASHFAIWLLTSPDSLYTEALPEESDREIASGIAQLYRRLVDGDKPTEEEWLAVESLAAAASEEAWTSYCAADRAYDQALDEGGARARLCAYIRYHAIERVHALAASRGDLERSLAISVAAARGVEHMEKFFSLAGEKLLELMAGAPVPVTHGAKP